MYAGLPHRRRRRHQPAGVRQLPGRFVRREAGVSPQPSSGTAGAPLSAFVAAVEDINSNILVGDTSTVTLTLSHGTFANGQTTVSAQAVDGIATFSNLVINAAGSYILRATDTNPNLDPGYGPFTINPGARRQAGVRPAADERQRPARRSAPPSPSPVEDANGNTVTADTSTVTLTLSSGTFASGGNTATASAVNGVATFGNLVINTAGTYTLAASDGTLDGRHLRVRSRSRPRRPSR